MEKIYIDAEDKNVAANIIYTEDGETFTYDAEGVNEVKAEDMFNLFVKGVLAVKDNVYYKPLSCTADGEIAFDFPTE